MNMPFELSTLILGLALALLFGAVVAVPLLERPRPAVEPPTPLELLENERAVVIRNIRELDFDHRTGKIDDADYAALRARLLENGADLLRRMESMQHEESSRDVRREIEDQVARLRARSTRACSACVAVLRQDDKFCPQCGEKVQA